jgi:hypothetical protein
MKHDEAAKIVAVLFASYPNGKFDRDNAKAFVDGIVDLDAAACGHAVQRLIRTNKFLPSVAEIREAYATLLQSKRAALARERSARIPTLTRAELIARDGHLQLALPKQTNGAAASPSAMADLQSRRLGAASAAPADLTIAAKPPRAPARPPRRWTSEELEAELARTGGGSP